MRNNKIIIERCDSCREKHRNEVEEMSKEERDEYINSIADRLKDMCSFVDDACDLMKQENHIAAAICLGEAKNTGLKYFMELNL